jgi:ubiquinone/menaquinone biosynthesis C-methylase UbiE
VENDTKGHIKGEDENHNESIISFFDKGIPWWTEIYREDLPKGFFSFEMRQRLKFVTDLLAAQIQKMDNPEVLDCGCGPGEIMTLLAPLHCKLTGLDLNRRYLEMAAEKTPGANLIEGNVERLPFPDKSFDIVFAVGVLMYLKDDRKAAEEIARVTKNNGIILISVPNYRMLHLLIDPYYIFRIFLKIIGKEKQSSDDGFGEKDIRRYSLTQLRNLFHHEDLREIQSIITSFGPLRFWRKEILPVKTSIRISEILRKLSERKICSGLKHVGNQIILILRKEPISDGSK